VPVFERDGVALHHEEQGRGYPVLLFAPGGMRSSIPFWSRAPWNPIEALAGHFRVIAMDQRNAGQSRAPVTAADGWHTYTRDHLALLDHLGVERCHVLGGCIGGPYCLGLIQAAPQRVAAAVLQQPIGRSADNQPAFFQLFDGWADELRRAGVPLDDQALASFRDHMFGGEFVFNVSRDFVRACRTPLLVLMGNDIYHPEETSREVAALAPNAELVERWKEPDATPAAVAQVIQFLQSHTP
jgi:pimeloyl-ACP methyl ester carboxylesterase